MKAARQFAILLFFPVLISHRTLAATDQLTATMAEAHTADKATLTFANLRQPTDDVLVLDLKNMSDNVGMEVSGIVGFTTLRFLNIDIDYRDGLVFMQYRGPLVR